MKKAVLFDAGSTLLYANPSVQNSFIDIAQKYSIKLDSSVAESAMAKVDTYYEKRYKLNGDFWCSPQGCKEIWYDQYNLFCELSGLDNIKDKVVDEIYDRYLHGSFWGIYSDVIPVFDALSAKNVNIGIVSNWNSNLHSILDDLGLSKYCDSVVLSAEHGVRKPDAKLFKIALDELNISASDAIYVGDLPKTDGYGAECAGIFPLIIDRDIVYPNCNYTTISSLMDIVQYI